jgi:hypothetical protein
MRDRALVQAKIATTDVVAGVTAAAGHDRNRCDVGYPTARIEMAYEGMILRMNVRLDTNPKRH